MLALKISLFWSVKTIIFVQLGFTGLLAISRVLGISESYSPPHLEFCIRCLCKPAVTSESGSIPALPFPRGWITATVILNSVLRGKDRGGGRSDCFYLCPLPLCQFFYLLEMTLSVMGTITYFWTELQEETWGQKKRWKSNHERSGMGSEKDMLY